MISPASSRATPSLDAIQPTLVTPNPLCCEVTSSIRPSSAEPIYRQLADQVRRRVVSGQIRAGDEIPSVRQMALLLAVNPMTISKAYGLLKAEGLLEKRRGLTMRVAPQHQRAQPAASRIELLRPVLSRAASEARQLQLPTHVAMGLFEELLKEDHTATAAARR